MEKILSFYKFIKENESVGAYENYKNLPKKLRSIIEEQVGKNILGKLIGSPDFNIYLLGEDLYIEVEGNKSIFPFIKWRNGEIFYEDRNIGDKSVYDKFYKELNLTYDVLPYTYYSVNPKESPYPWFQYNSDTQYSIRVGLGNILSKIDDHIRKNRKTKLLNPFTDVDLDKSKWMDIIKKMGGVITSTERQKKTGTIEIRFKDLSIRIVITNTGYIRRLDDMDHSYVLSTNPQIGRPIYTEEDLNIKLSYVSIYCIKYILSINNVSSNVVNKITKEFLSGNFTEYNDAINLIAKENPTIYHLLPDPDNVLDQSLKKASKIISRFF